MVQKNESTEEKKSQVKQKASSPASKRMKTETTKTIEGEIVKKKSKAKKISSVKKDEVKAVKPKKKQTKEVSDKKTEGETVVPRTVRKTKTKTKKSTAEKIMVKGEVKPFPVIEEIIQSDSLKEIQVKKKVDAVKKTEIVEPKVIPVKTEDKKPFIEQVAVQQKIEKIVEAQKTLESKPEVQEKKYIGTIKINEITTLRDLADKMNQNPAELLKKMLSMGSLATINQRLDIDTATLLAHEFDYELKLEAIYEEESLKESGEDPSKLKPRSPVVTIMGHVDHGKTSLLDAFRKSRVAEGEAGGITQHIGAYKVKTQNGEITFLDTPGHEAFTSMRSRGAQATDIVVLVVSAGDGVMPQTVEAIDHAKAAGVPIIVAINKIDLPQANSQQVKQELSGYNLLAEDWGGDVIMVEVSAKQLLNIDQLLEMILLKAEMMELKANPDRLARGVVIEAKLDSRRGSVATVLVQAGTLRVSDNFIVGTTYGKVRAMVDEHGKRLEEAGPSTPVEVMGINAPPQAGDQFVVVSDERTAREIAQVRQSKAKEESYKPRHHLSLEDINAGKVKEVRLILKADVQGSLEAISDSLERLSTSEISLKIIHRGAGRITESDVALATASDAFIVGFNLKPDSNVEKIADKEGVNIRTYRIIYELIADIRAAMEGLLEPQINEIKLGKALVKQVFKASKLGMIAGSVILDGKALRGCKARLIRDGVVVYEGNITSLRRFKDDVKEVDKGYECGIGFENYTDYKADDIVELYTLEKVARKL